MAGYVEVSDEDRRWAANTHDNEVIYRGPCGQLFVWIDHSIETIKEQSLVQNMLLMLAFFFICALGNILLEDETVSVMVRGGDACAAPNDLLDQEHQRCRTHDKLALAFLQGKPWVSCASSSMVGHDVPPPFPSSPPPAPLASPCGDQRERMAVITADFGRDQCVGFDTGHASRPLALVCTRAVNCCDQCKTSKATTGTPSQTSTKLIISTGDLLMNLP